MVDLAPWAGQQGAEPLTFRLNACRVRPEGLWGAITLRHDSLESESELVTFLMTDVEGSTRLWETDGRAMDQAMVLHDRIIEEVTTAAGGEVVKPRGEGDSRFCVFSAPDAALHAALAAQQRLASQRWPTSRPVRVRSAVYTGRATERDNDFYGTAPNRCARLREMGHAQQILVGERTAAMARDLLPSGAELSALGPYRLRDVDAPEVVHQLDHRELPRDFPPLRATEALHNLPQMVTRFVGRSPQVAELRTLLDEHRIISLAGAAGVGKTRLALEVARTARGRFADGVWFVELAALRDPNALARTVVDALNLDPTSSSGPADVLADFTRHKQLLLVLDNCEHVVDASAALIGALLSDSPGLSVIATTREVLGVPGELAYRVGPLVCPDDSVQPDDLDRYEATLLFCERARLVDANFSPTAGDAGWIARICRRLDGIPLAIELAAGRTALLPIDKIAQRLDDRFALLTGGPRRAIERHQTMLAALDWSHALLTPAEAAMLRRLGTFAGGFSIDAACAVTAFDPVDPTEAEAVLASLEQKSMVHRDPSAKGRFRLLETMRTYALARLEDAEEATAARIRHLGWFADLAHSVRDQLRGGPDIKECRERLAPDSDNLVAAIAFAAQERRPEGLRLLDDLDKHWTDMSAVAEVLDAARRLLAELSETDDVQRSRALMTIAALEDVVPMAFDHVVETTRESFTYAERSGDPPTIAASAVRFGTALLRAGDHVQARELMDLAITTARTCGAEHTLALALGRLGHLHHVLGDAIGAQHSLRAAIAIAREGEDPEQTANLLATLGLVLTIHGHHHEARGPLTEALATLRSIESLHGIATATQYLGVASFYVGDFEAAEEAYRESLLLADRCGKPSVVRTSQVNLAELFHVRGDLDRARRELTMSLALFDPASPERPWVHTALGRVELDAGHTGVANEHFVSSLRLLPRAGHLYLPQVLEGLAATLVESEKAALVCTLAAAADAARRAGGAEASTLEAGCIERLMRHLNDVMAREDFEEAWAVGQSLSKEAALQLAYEAAGIEPDDGGSRDS